MLESVKYSSIFFVVTAILVSVIVIFLIVDFYNTRLVIMKFCQDAGFRFEDRNFHGLIRGYCVFDELSCANTSPPTNLSECLGIDFFLGTCWPCLNPAFSCDFFENVDYCPQDIEFVCARVRVGVVEPFTVIEETIGNACTACYNSKRTRLVTSYVNGSCPDPWTLRQP